MKVILLLIVFWGITNKLIVTYCSSHCSHDLCATPSWWQFLQNILEKFRKLWDIVTLYYTVLQVTCFKLLNVCHTGMSYRMSPHTVCLTTCLDTGKPKQADLGINRMIGVFFCSFVFGTSIICARLNDTQIFIKMSRKLNSNFFQTWLKLCFERHCSTHWLFQL